MARYDFSAHRLYVDAVLAPGAHIDLDRQQANYLCNVLRLPDGAELLIFNGRDGEWRAALTDAGRKSASLKILAMTRPQEGACDLHYIFAPLKHARLDYMVQKAVEMGASLLQPVQTQHTQPVRLNLERMRANIIEAAEQCGIIAVPRAADPIGLDKLLDSWEPERRLIFCDEDAPINDPVAALRAAQEGLGANPSLAVLIGPEGGFDSRERGRLIALPQSIRLSLGPRILRADTAAVAALSLVQAVLGDTSARALSA
jgi:16S rRNA (uracil1498-N3)-methyltransferase